MDAPAEPIPSKLRKNYSFHFLWTSTFASGFADRLAMLAVGVMLGQGMKDEILKLHDTSNASIVAGINFWFFLPYVIWGPFAGWLADRLPRKWLMFISDEMRGLIILFAYTLLPDGKSGYVQNIYDTWICVGGIELSHSWKIWFMMFAIGLFAATFSPARNSVIPNVVGYKLLQRANSMVLGMGVIGNLLGFGLGGGLAETALSACILTSAMCYIIPGFMWPFLKTPVRRHAKHAGKGSGPISAFREVKQGARYVIHHRPLIALTLVSILFWSGSHIIMACGSAIAVGLYQGTVEEFAFIGGAFGLGMLIGAVVLGFLNSRLGGELVILVGMVGVALFLSALTVVPVLNIGIVLAVCCGFFGGMIMITVNTMTQQLTADGYRGRVMGFKDLASDLGGVAVSFVIWAVGISDRNVLYVADFFAAALIASAIVGARRYAFTGPIHRPSLNLLWRINRFYCQSMHRLEAIGSHDVPRDGPVLLVATHTAGIDPMAIQACIPRRVRWMMAADMMIGPLGLLWRALEIIKVDRQKPDRTAAREAIEALKDGQVVCIFPEGGINQQGNELMPFAEGVSLIAARSKCPIVPVALWGTPKGGTAYSALLKFSKTRIAFGKPFTVDDLAIDTRQRHQRHAAVATAISQRIAALASAHRDA